MPFALAIIGIVFLVTAIRGTTSQLFGLIKDDFTGSGNYLYWVVSILVIGGVGYIKKLEGLSTAFLGLVLIALFFSNRGFFAQFSSALKTGSNNCPQAQPDPGSAAVLNQIANTPSPVLATPGQSSQQAIGNMFQNFNSALGNSSTLFGG